MRVWVLLVAAVCSLSCRDSEARAHAQAQWTHGFWFWRGSAASITAAGTPVDVVFAQVGSIRLDAMFDRRDWVVSGYLPDQLPPAKEYWLVFRYEGQGVPAPEVVSKLANGIAELRKVAARRQLPVSGIQLDIDSPTGKLPEYATFLRGVREAVAKDLRISITALLDWFRGGTAIGDVLKSADEFVPQFYDTQDSYRSDGRTKIAAPVSAAIWGPALNRYRKPFRIGISTFGRSRLIPRPAPPGVQHSGVMLIGDLKPLDVALNPAFTLQTSRTKAQELVLNNEARTKVRIGYSDVRAGDKFEVVLPTADGIRTAVEEARRMGGYCTGVLFFRWPAFDETLAEHPADVLKAVGAITDDQPTVQLRTSDGACAAVKCVDLYLIRTGELSPHPVRYSIRSSTDLEYFLPADRMPVRMSGPSEIEVSFPPYAGRGRMHLGRAVTAERAAFTLEVAQ